MSHDNVNISNFETVRVLQNEFIHAKLGILSDKAKLKARRFEFIDDGWAGEDALQDPAVIASDVASQISFLRKLKFQYLEQNAKDKYIKTIVSDIDDAPLITAATNQHLKASNEAKKSLLKSTKTKLAQKHEDIRTLSPLVEQDHHRTQALTSEAIKLSQQILDARLALRRLRQIHPQPRLTISSANAQLDFQVTEMQETDAQLQRVNERVNYIKEKVKEGAKEIQRMRLARAAAEEVAKEGQTEIEDGRIVGLYDWLMASQILRHSLLSLVSLHKKSDNELQVTYSIDNITLSWARSLVITVLYAPDTRQLAAAQIQGVNVDFGDLIDTQVQGNDISRLVWSGLARASKL